MVFDLAGLLRSLVDRDVEFIVVGGIAVAAHAVVRATEDLDLVPGPDAANLDRLLDVLSSLDARLLLNPERALDPEVRRALHTGRNLTLTTRLGDVDVIMRLPGVPVYDELRSEAIEVELHGARFNVCSRAHLVAMKRSRGSALDQADIERLIDGGDHRSHPV